MYYKYIADVMKHYWQGKLDVGHAYIFDFNNDTETDLITLLSRNYEQSQP